MTAWPPRFDTEPEVDEETRNPQGYRKVVGEARKAGVRNFPYALWFKWDEDESLVIACLHGRQNPMLAQKEPWELIPCQDPNRIRTIFPKGRF